MNAAVPADRRPRGPRASGRATEDRSTSDLTEPSTEHEGARPSPIARVLLGLIAVYRWTAAVRTPRCRFAPTCSSYAAESVRTHGAARGGWLAIRRISRCHPWNPGGVDHVPPRK